MYRRSEILPFPLTAVRRYGYESTLSELRSAGENNSRLARLSWQKRRQHRSLRKYHVRYPTEHGS